MHHKSLQKLIIDIYKIANGLCPKIMNEVFQIQIQKYHNLRNSSTFIIPSFNTIFKRKGSESYLDPNIRIQVPEEIKSLESLNSFKKAVKKWVPQMCQRRLFKTL